MKRWLSVLLTLCLLFTSITTTLAAQTQQSSARDNRSIMYDGGIGCLEHGGRDNIEEAIEYFESLGSYKDSEQYLVYAQARLDIENEAFSDAVEKFQELASDDFLDSIDYDSYAKGRLAEEQGKDAQAYDDYEGLTILDAQQRRRDLGTQLDGADDDDDDVYSSDDDDDVYSDDDDDVYSDDDVYEDDSTDDDDVYDDDGDDDEDDNSVESLSKSMVVTQSSFLTSGYRLGDASYALDGDMSTAWCEGLDDEQGLQEWIKLSVPRGGDYRVSGFKIVNGYGRNAREFQQNSRVRDLEVQVDGNWIGTYTLGDEQEWQSIYFDEAVSGTDFMFKIRAVYPGGDEKQTCITEIRLTYDDPSDIPYPTPAPYVPGPSGNGTPISKYESADEVPKSGYFCPDSAKKLLSYEDLRSTSLEVLDFVRNEILARHGYLPAPRKYKDYFQSRTWFKKKSGDVYSKLSKTEAQNIERIKEVTMVP